MFYKNANSIRERQSMKPVTAAKTKYGIWGLIIGACVTMIVGFSWGGWSTSSTTKNIAQEAVVNSEAVICVAQFRQIENYAEKMKEFEETTSYSRAEFIGKGGWDKMPGQNEADYQVAQACANELESTI
jgi:hypothetical protein